MPTPRVYSPSPLRSHSTQQLDPTAHRHITQVLRMGPGEQITLFDGSGWEYLATLEEVGRRQSIVSLTQGERRDCESPRRLHLFQALSKGERMELAIQKGTELGVTAITPIVTARTVVRLDPQRLNKKTEHWQQVAISACEQSGRNRIPTIHTPMKLTATGLATEGHGYLLSPVATTTLNQAPAPKREEPISLLIGPEGGLTPGEIETLVAQGWNPVRLGPRILRTETAAIAAITLLQHLHGDL